MTASGPAPTAEPDVVELPGRGARLAVRRTHPGSEPRALAVLVHGLASNARMWDACAAALATGGVVSVSVDQREHGASAALGAEGTVDTPTAVADLVALAAALQSEPAHAGLPVLLVGQSWGGNVVLAAAATRRVALAGVALVDGGWLRFDADEPFERLWQRLAPPGWGGARMGDVTARLSQALDGWGPHALPAVLGNLTSDPPDDPDGSVRNVLPLAAHERILRSMHDSDPRRLYPLVDVPVLLAPAGGPAGALVQEAVEGLARPVLRRYPDAHHDLHLQHPQRLADDLLALLDLAAGAGTAEEESA